MPDETERHYMNVELIDTSDPRETVMQAVEADDYDEVVEVLEAMDTLGMLRPETEVRVKKMTNLDAPLSEEESDQLASWIEGMVEDSPEPDDACRECYGTGTVSPNEGYSTLMECPECDGHGDTLPREGDVLVDPDANPKYGDGRVRIEEVTNDTAEGYYYNPRKTVAQANPSYPDDDRVVVASYVEGSDTHYAFPVSRLEEP